MARCVGGVGGAEGVGLTAGKAFLRDVCGGGADDRRVVGAGDGDDGSAVSVPPWPSEMV
jgi:hypothetical protein